MIFGTLEKMKNVDEHSILHAIDLVERKLSPNYKPASEANAALERELSNWPDADRIARQRKLNIIQQFYALWKMMNNPTADQH